MLERVGAMAVPCLLGVVGALLLFGRRPYLKIFLEGAREGLQTAVGLLPTLLLLVVGISMLQASGVPMHLSALLRPVTGALGIPEELLPLLLTRPFSGSAATATYADLLARYGADSFVALCASVIMGSTDTLFYVIGVYFSAVGVRKSRYAIPVAILVMLFGTVFSVLICRIWFK